MSVGLFVVVQGEHGLPDWANATEHAVLYGVAVALLGHRRRGAVTTDTALIGQVSDGLQHEAGHDGIGAEPEQRAAGYWPGGGGQWSNNEYGDNVTLYTDYDDLDQARDDADVIAEWLLANGWGDCLEAAYVDDGAGSRTRHDRGYNRG